MLESRLAKFSTSQVICLKNVKSDNIKQPNSMGMVVWCCQTKTMVYMQILEWQLWFAVLMMFIGGITLMAENRNHKNYAALCSAGLGSIIAAVLGGLFLYFYV